MEENKVVVIRLCPYFIRARNEQSGDIKYDTGKSSKLMLFFKGFLDYSYKFTDMYQPFCRRRLSGAGISAVVRALAYQFGPGSFPVA